MQIRKTICDICNPLTHCGLDVHVRNGEIVLVEGSADNPHNAGAICCKGAASRQYVHHPDRLLRPLIRKRKSGGFVPVDWADALDLIAERLLGIRSETGPESVVFFAGYPKWMRPFLKRLAHGFGSPNFCTESSTCATAAQMASRLNYGCVGQPDLAATRCLIVWSRNPFATNITAVGPIMAAAERGVKIIEVGPMITPLTRYAALHLRNRPGTSGALALGMAHVIIDEGRHDRDFVENWSLGFDDYRAYVRRFTPEAVERITGVPREDIAAAARLYADTRPAAMLNGASPTVHHTNGVQNHRAITALIGLTGNFDRPGGNRVRSGFFHMPCNLPNREHGFEQSRPWPEMAPRVGEAEYPLWCRMIPEAQAMRLPFQMQSRSPYPIRSIVGFGLNHRMWPGSDFMRGQLENLEFFVNVDLFMTDTCRMADVILPACSSFERGELKVYPEDFAICTRPVMPPLGNSRPDTDIIFDLAARLTPDDELLAAGYDACMDWMLEPSGLKMEWIRSQPNGCRIEGIAVAPPERYRAEKFPTPSGKMEFASGLLEEIGQDPLPAYREPALSPVATSEVALEYPLVLTTGSRLPMFVHSRTFRVGWLRELRPEPMADVHPRDAADRGIEDGDAIVLTTGRGSIRVKAHLTEVLPPGVVGMHHGYPEADVNTLIAPDYLDPISGFPGFKSMLCQVTRAEG